MADDFDEWLRAQAGRDLREDVNQARSWRGPFTFEPEPDPLHEPWLDPQAAGRAVDRRYLEFARDKSAKFYAAVLATGPSGWLVSFNFGRIGTPRAWALKISASSEVAARKGFDSLIAGKTRAGYEQRPWPSDLWLPGEADPEEMSSGSVGTESAYRSGRDGTLPPASGGPIGGIDLPPGSLVAPSAEHFGAQEPVVWVSEYLGDAGELWGRLVRAFGETGLWPLMVEDEMGPGDLAQIVAGPVADDGGDPGTILRSWWMQHLEGGDAFQPEDYAPLGQSFPGLATPSRDERPTDLDRLMRGQTGRIALVRARRPADVLAAVGWEGAVNYGLNQAEQSAVLRSWEDRFDAYLVGFGWATITLAVGRPPTNRLATTRIAAEHFAFCPDVVWQGVGSTVREYVDYLIGRPIWGFWWD